MSGLVRVCVNIFKLTLVFCLFHPSVSSLLVVVTSGGVEHDFQRPVLSVRSCTHVSVTGQDNRGCFERGMTRAEADRGSVQTIIVMSH